MTYDNPQTGETIILVINQALYFDELLPHLLLNPKQNRTHGIIVDDVWKHIQKDATHSICIPDEKLHIPLNLHGVISYFSVCTPTKKEIETCVSIELTSGTTEWDPHSNEYAEHENACTDNYIHKIALINIEHDEHYDTIMRKKEAPLCI